jgi:predicted transcriptional regulator
VASAVAELRALAPHRPLPAWEARILAERQAAKLLALQGVRDLPVPELLIEHLPRVDVVYRRSRSLSGSAKWTGGRWVIVVNANDTWGRQRFSLCHELKHVIDAPAEAALYRDRGYAWAAVQRERAADYFAACLLMPKTLLKRAVYEQGLRDDYELARHCQVSVAAMRVRLAELQLLGPEAVAA